MNTWRVGLLAALAWAACAAGAPAQTRTVKVGGKEIKLQVSQDYILAQPKNTEAPLSKDEAARLARDVVAAQTKSTREVPDPYLQILTKRPPRTVPQMQGVLAPRFSRLNTLEIHKLAGAMGGARATARVYQHRGKLIVPLGTVTVSFKEKPTADLLAQFARDLQAEEVSRPGYLPNLVKFRRKTEDTPSDAFALVEGIRTKFPGQIRWAEPDLVQQTRKSGFAGAGPYPVADDAPAAAAAAAGPWHPQYWHKMARVREDWDVVKLRGSDRVTVAVLDDGVDVGHKAFKDHLASGRNFVREAQGKDPPQNGGTFGTDQDFHGTACAGIIAAEPVKLSIAGPDGQKKDYVLSGVAPGCKVLPLRMIGSDFVSDDDVAEAFLDAQRQKARILNVSWGLEAPSEKVREALRKAQAGGCLVVAAAGNDIPADDVAFPASEPGVVAVGALRQDRTRWSYSNFGPGNQVTLVAPAGNIQMEGDMWTTDLAGPRGWNGGADKKGDAAGDFLNAFGGTSGACPVVAGVAALVWSAYPDLSVDQVRQALVESAEKVDANGESPYKDGRSTYYGYGLVNAEGALAKAKLLASSARAAPAAPAARRAVAARRASSGGRAAQRLRAQPARDEAAADSVPRPTSEKQVAHVLKPTPRTWTSGKEAAVAYPSSDWVTVLTSKNLAARKDELKTVMNAESFRNVDKLAQVVYDGPTSERAVVRLPRTSLDSPERLLANARARKLPPIFPVYEVNGSPFYPTGTITAHFSGPAAAKDFKDNARKYGLEVASERGDQVKVRLAEVSPLQDIFDAARQLKRLEGAAWAEPDSVTRVGGGPAGLKR